jgi:hypothetical protein
MRTKTMWAVGTGYKGQEADTVHFYKGTGKTPKTQDKKKQHYNWDTGQYEQDPNIFCDEPNRVSIGSACHSEFSSATGITLKAGQVLKITVEKA